jgi:hypothetical protein
MKWTTLSTRTKSNVIAAFVARLGLSRLALQQHLPLAVAIFECSPKPIAAEFSSQRLPPDRSAKRAVWVHSPMNALSVICELCLAGHRRTLDGNRNSGRLASGNIRGDRTAPLPIECIGLSGKSSTELGQEQHWKEQYQNDRNDKRRPHLQTIPGMAGPF